MKAYTDIEEISGKFNSDWDVNEKLKKKGLHLIGIRIERPAPDSDGEFKEVFHYLVGKPVDDTSVD